MNERTKVDKEHRQHGGDNYSYPSLRSSSSTSPSWYIGNRMNPPATARPEIACHSVVNSGGMSVTGDCSSPAAGTLSQSQTSERRREGRGRPAVFNGSSTLHRPSPFSSSSTSSSSSSSSPYQQLSSTDRAFLSSDIPSSSPTMTAAAAFSGVMAASGNSLYSTGWAQSKGIFESHYASKDWPDDRNNIDNSNTNRSHYNGSEFTPQPQPQPQPQQPGREQKYSYYGAAAARDSDDNNNISTSPSLSSMSGAGGVASMTFSPLRGTISRMPSNSTLLLQQNPLYYHPPQQHYEHQNHHYQKQQQNVSTPREENREHSLDATQPRTFNNAASSSSSSFPSHCHPVVNETKNTEHKSVEQSMKITTNKNGNNGDGDDNDHDKTSTKIEDDANSKGVDKNHKQGNLNDKNDDENENDNDDHETTIIISPRRSDVLSLRGNAGHSHSGNQFYRALISMYKEQFDEASTVPSTTMSTTTTTTTTSVAKRRLIVQKIVNAIHERNGRFLKQLEEEEEIEEDNDSHDNDIQTTTSTSTTNDSSKKKKKGKNKWVIMTPKQINTKTIHAFRDFYKGCGDEESRARRRQKWDEGCNIHLQQEGEKDDDDDGTENNNNNVLQISSLSSSNKKKKNRGGGGGVKRKRDGTTVTRNDGGKITASTSTGSTSSNNKMKRPSSSMTIESSTEKHDESTGEVATTEVKAASDETSLVHFELKKKKKKKKKKKADEREKRDDGTNNNNNNNNENNNNMWKKKKKKKKKRKMDHLDDDDEEVVLTSQMKGNNDVPFSTFGEEGVTAVQSRNKMKKKKRSGEGGGVGGGSADSTTICSVKTQSLDGNTASGTANLDSNAGGVHHSQTLYGGVNDVDTTRTMSAHTPNFNQVASCPKRRLDKNEMSIMNKSGGGGGGGDGGQVVAPSKTRPMSSTYYDTTSSSSSFDSSKKTWVEKSLQSPNDHAIGPIMRTIDNCSGSVHGTASTSYTLGGAGAGAGAGIHPYAMELITRIMNHVDADGFGGGDHDTDGGGGGTTAAAASVSAILDEEDQHHETIRLDILDNGVKGDVERKNSDGLDNTAVTASAAVAMNQERTQESRKMRLIRLQLKQRYMAALRVGIAPKVFSERLLQCLGVQLGTGDLTKTNSP